jgi:hypothetical protein
MMVLACGRQLSKMCFNHIILLKKGDIFKKLMSNPHKKLLLEMRQFQLLAFPLFVFCAIFHFPRPI